MSFTTLHGRLYVGAAEGCDLLILSGFENANDQKIAACGSSYGGMWKMSFSQRP
jgi:hypothetical protein